LKIGDLVRVVSYQGHTVGASKPLLGVIIDIHTSHTARLLKLRVKDISWIVYDYEVELVSGHEEGDE
jgi:hypothetical protein